MIKENNRKAPRVRFPGFTDDWEQRKFEECYTMSSGFAFKYQDYCEEGIPLINGESIQHGVIDDSNLNHLPVSFVNDYPNFVLHTKDIVLGLNRPITNGSLKIARIPNKFDGSLLYQRAGKIQYKEDLDVDFSYILLSKEVLKFTLKEAVGSDQPFISTSKLDKWNLCIPSDKDEQSKIGAFFMGLDNLITLHQRELTNLETQKKAVMKKIFSQEVRFKRADGSDFPGWEEKALGSFAKRVARKNRDNACNLPLTISAEYGLIDQSEFFNKTVASKDMSTYYLLQNGEFAFNKSASKDYPVGAIKRLDRYAVGAVSPLYICFELYGETVLSDFAVQYFETDCWHSGVLDIAQEGARTHGLLNISVPGFFETVHELPSDLEEQRLIADFLSDFDEAIEAAKKELELWKELKKGLLQQMFV